MPKLDLQGQLLISSELFSRLRARGLITADLKCTDDFIAYIQECIARDDARIPHGAPLQPTMCEESLKAKSAECEIKESFSSSPLKNTTTNTQTQVDANLVKDRLSVLYNRG